MCGIGFYDGDHEKGEQMRREMRRPLILVGFMFAIGITIVVALMGYGLWALVSSLAHLFFG